MSKSSEERARVAILLADPKRIDAHLKLVAGLHKDGYSYDHWQDPNMWESLKYYHLFQLLLWIRSDQEPPGFWKRLTDEGRELIAKEQKT